MKTTKSSERKQRIVELERKLMEALAGRVQRYHLASYGLDMASRKHLHASGAVITVTGLGGKELMPPTLLLDGLSDELIAALREDINRSYTLAVTNKPKGLV